MWHSVVENTFSDCDYGILTFVFIVQYLMVTFLSKVSLFMNSRNCHVLLWSVELPSKMKSDQVRVSKLLTDTVTLLCKNGLVFSQEIKVQGLLGITVDKNEVFLVDINEVIGGNVAVPSGKHASTAASSEPPRKKNTFAGSTTKVVDLTRVADTPHVAVQPPVASQPPVQAGQIAARRKHRQAMRLVPPPMMIPRQPQPVPPGMQHGFHPRMNVSPVRGNAMASQMASSYMAQLQQQVARGMSPMCRTPPRRPRPVNRRPMEVMPPSQAGSVEDDDDEDVVIVGTGHEEPSPSWSSPLRKRPLPSHMSSSPASLQKNRGSSYQPPEKKPAMRDSPTVIEQLGGGDVASSLQLSADDIPTSIEDMILNIAPAVVATPIKHSSRAAVLPEICNTDVTASDKVEGISETAVPVLPTDDSAALAELVQPDGAVVGTVIADDENKAATTSQLGENTAEPSYSLIYTDIACDLVSSILV